MSDLVNVQYANVIDTMKQNQSIVTNEISYCSSLIKQAHVKMEEMGGAGNNDAMEGLAMFQSGANLLAEAINHFMEAITASTQHLQSEEKIIAKSFDLL